MTSNGPRPTADIVALARRSIVGVRAMSSGGTGWVALANGLVLTSHEAVGYQVEVALELDGGRRAEGRVIWVDVPRDLALVLPASPLALPPLIPRPDLPRVGESVIALAALPDQPFRALPVYVSAVDHRLGSIRCFEIDAAVGSAGGPILDGDGRVVGIGGLDLPRGTRRRLAHAPAGWSLALPIAALQRALAAFDLTAGQFADRAPVYRCPGCAEPYAVEDERCLACGHLLPHVWELDATCDESALAAAEDAVRDLLTELGAVATSVRVGPRSFRLEVPLGDARVDLTLELSARGFGLAGRLPLMRIPATGQEAFYRFLLTLNDQSTRGLRLSIDGDTVHLGFAEPIALVRQGEGLVRFKELLREGERYKKALEDTFEGPAPG